VSDANGATRERRERRDALSESNGLKPQRGKDRTVVLPDTADSRAQVQARRSVAGEAAANGVLQLVVAGLTVGATVVALVASLRSTQGSAERTNLILLAVYLLVAMIALGAATFELRSFLRRRAQPPSKLTIRDSELRQLVVDAAEGQRQVEALLSHGERIDA